MCWVGNIFYNMAVIFILWCTINSNLLNTIYYKTHLVLVRYWDIHILSDFIGHNISYINFKISNFCNSICNWWIRRWIFSEFVSICGTLAFILLIHYNSIIVFVIFCKFWKVCYNKLVYFLTALHSFFQPFIF